MKTTNTAIIPPKSIELKNSLIPKAGRGIFATKTMKKGEMIETAPVFVLPKNDYSTIKRTSIRDYYFMWGKTTAAICFGYGSMYNHSYQPNATYTKKIKDKTIEFKAIRDIKPGEEITVNYNYGNPASKKKLWIKSIKPENSD